MCLKCDVNFFLHRKFNLFLFKQRKRPLETSILKHLKVFDNTDALREVSVVAVKNDKVTTLNSRIIFFKWKLGSGIYDLKS